MSKLDMAKAARTHPQGTRVSTAALSTRAVAALLTATSVLGITLVILVTIQFQKFSAERSSSFMQSFCGWLETSAYSTWLRESLSVWVFPVNLTAHTLSM